MSETSLAGIFGYGSLLLQRSFEATLGRPYTQARHFCEVRGWTRRWTSLYPNTRFRFKHRDGAVLIPDHILYLNVHPAETSINGVVYWVSPQELEAFDRREAVYSRIEVRPERWQPPRPESAHLRDAPVYMYVGKEPYVLRTPLNEIESRQAAIRRTYVEILEQGLQEVGSAFAAEFRRTGEPAPSHLIIQDEPIATVT